MYEIYLKLLNEKGWKTSDVCKATGIVASTFSDWKKGKSSPKADKLQKIADCLGVSLEYLMTGEEDEQTYYLDPAVYYYNETFWLTQKAMAELFGVNIPAISKHLGNIFADGELDKDSVISILETTASDGKKYNTKYYSLDAIIAVGYRVNSLKAARFRQWATSALTEFLI